MTELLQAAIHEIVADPVKFGIELVQFAILVFLVKAIAFGLKKDSKGVLGKVLADRRTRVEAQIDRIETAETRLLDARGEATSMVAQANLDARAVLRQARATSKRETAAAEEALAAEVNLILDQARESIARERAETMAAIHDQLVDVVVMSTRQMLDQGMAPQEQREMVRRTIMESLDDLDRVVLA